MRLPKLPAATLAATLLVLVAAAPAQAGRTAEDPCAEFGDSTHLLPRDGVEQRLCLKKFEIPPHRTVTDPTPYGDSECPKGYFVYDEGEQWGDYWTYRGEWVTWSPLAGTHNKKSVHPGYHNWSSWDWPTRTILRCYQLDRFTVSLLQADEDEDETPRAPAGPDDVVQLGAGDDTKRGGRGDDALYGQKGDDELRGGAGDDQLLGGRGEDELFGGPGSDELFDDEGRDHLDGGPGDDRFSARDGNRDVIDCGPGEDIAIGDPKDRFVDCEHVYTTAAGTPDEPPVIG